jgi:hypothetical protein
VEPTKEVVEVSKSKSQPVKKYLCAYCEDRWLPADQMIYSAWTGNRYCAIDQKRCERKGAKAKRRRIAEKRRQRREGEQAQVAA